MGKGQYPKIKGAICNIPVNVNDVVDVLPRSSHSSGILLVKLKKKIEFKGHVYFEPVCPENVRSALLFLKVNNPLYKDVVINMDRIPQELRTFDQDEQIDIEIEQDLEQNSTEIETDRNPLDEFRQACTESCAVPNISHDESLFEVAPGEGKSPFCIITDDCCEELAFPQYFSKCRFGYNMNRDVKLTPVKYFNQRLLNYKQIFASCADYIFFAQFVIQQFSLRSHINIAMRKATNATSYTAGMFSNYKETVQSIV